MADIIKLDNYITRLDLNASEILTYIAKEEPGNVFVICWPKDGGVPTYHSSTGDVPVILMRLQEFTHKHFNGDFSG